MIGRELRAAVLCAIALGCSQGPAQAESFASVDVTVEGVRGTQGVVTISLCTRQEYAVDDCRLMRSISAAPPRVMVSFGAVRAGRYAVVVFHDLDGDGEVARGFLGLPKEGVGFSRNPSLWRKPRFEDVAVDLGTSARQVTVGLKFEPSVDPPGRR